MKKVALLAFMAWGLFACSEDDISDTSANTESVAAIRINVQGDAFSRSIETDHPGNDGTEVIPQIFNVAVIPYDMYGNSMGEILIEGDQLKQAVYGNCNFTDGTSAPSDKPSGCKVGLPVGTKSIDVIANRLVYNPDDVTNINFFNYRAGEHPSSTVPTNQTSFQRVPLVTGLAAAHGKRLEGLTMNGTEYIVDFEVAPAFARIEVYGGINVALPQDWVDAYKNTWVQVAKGTFLTAAGVTEDEIGTQNAFGAVVGKTEDNWDPDIVYVPQYYWYKGTSGVGDPSEIVTSGSSKNVFTKEEIDLDNNGINAGWVSNADLIAKLTGSTKVQWLPNAYWAVDVEEIFVNNIKVASNNDPVSMINWPGNKTITGNPDTDFWRKWYLAYHQYGWHTIGKAADHSYYCMGNMWDRISDPIPYINGNTQDINITTIDGHSTTQIILKKAMKGQGKSDTYDKSLGSVERNIGIIAGKAAGYQIYAQKANAGAEKEELVSTLPHIIIKVKAYKTQKDYEDGNIVMGKEFITLKLFKSTDAAKGRITNFERSKIYRLNLGDLLGNFHGPAPVPGGKTTITPGDPIEPDPEMPGSQVEMTVKVLPWTIANMTPEI